MHLLQREPSIPRGAFSLQRPVFLSSFLLLLTRPRLSIIRPPRWCCVVRCCGEKDHDRNHHRPAGCFGGNPLEKPLLIQLPQEGGSNRQMGFVRSEVTFPRPVSRSSAREHPRNHSTSALCDRRYESNGAMAFGGEQLPHGWLSKRWSTGRQWPVTN